ncbi:mucin-5AC isoform X2 [Ooceraea biroi]|nr:mucin-5AC isoform X2 [Ooceraea biroi]
MDIRILTLLVLIGVLGSFTEARSAYFGYPNIRNEGLRAIFAAPTRLKRAVDSNGETTTTSQATTTTTPSTTPDSTTDPTTTEPTTTEPPTTTDPPTDPTTTPATTTTEATSPTTEATSPTTEATSPTTEATSPSTTPTTTGTTPSSTSATTPATTTSATTPESSTTPESTKPTSKPEKPKEDVLSRSDFDDSNKPEDSTEKPGPSSEGNKTPAPGPYGYPSFPYTPFGQFGPGFDPYFGYPGFNSIPGSGPNYAWTGMSGGPGYSAAGASAGASTGTFGYPGMGYPMTGNPMTGFPSAGSPTVDSRGGFQDNSANSPNLNGYPGYGSGGIDPLYNGPGFYFPGQFPNYNDPYEMFRQIQSQIEAQHRANMEFHNRLASEAANYDGAQLASASIGVGPTGGFQAGQISPAAPGIESRFAEELPPPSGNSYGVFASSSSSSMTGPDGKQINHKISTTGVNDNGQISFRTVHDK